jgi:hypothetical protein
MIHDCDENDGGEYSITIDEAKTSKAEVIVEVKEEPVRSEPIKANRFVQQLPSEISVDENESTLLQCEVENTDQETDWFFNDVLIDKKKKNFQVINNGTIRQLQGYLLIDFFLELEQTKILSHSLVSNAQLSDTGKITCKDRLSGETTQCNVTVNKAPIRLVKGFPETLLVPQGKVSDFTNESVDTRSILLMELYQ